MDGELRVAIVGLGIGRRHIQAYQRLPGVRVVALADIDEAALAWARSEFGISLASADYRQVLSRADVDAVSICTPDRLHAEQVLFALDAGKHVFCEKPLATTLQDAQQVAAKAAQTGLTVMVGQTYRFQPQFEELHALVRQGLIGAPYLAESSYIQDLYSMEKLGPNYWRFKDPQDFVLGGAVHNIDLLRWTMGEVQEVHAYATHVMHFYPLDDNYVCDLSFHSGRLGRVLLALGSRLKNKFMFDLRVYGPQGILSADLQRAQVVQNLAAAEGKEPLALPVSEENGHYRAIAHFVACLREGKRPLVDAAEGARTVAVCLAVIQSAREKRSVKVRTDM